jgi:hypothetical protein
VHHQPTKAKTQQPDSQHNENKWRHMPYIGLVRAYVSNYHIPGNCWFLVQVTGNWKVNDQNVFVRLANHCCTASTVAAAANFGVHFEPTAIDVGSATNVLHSVMLATVAIDHYA